MSSEADGRNPKTKPLHFLLVPLMSPGHMIPMVDLARLLAARGVLVTFATTPVNLARIRPIIDQAAASSLTLRFIDLVFPTADAGLPEGCESADLLPTRDLFLTFMKALPLLRDPLETHLRAPDPAHWPPPSCLISDSMQHWTAAFARDLAIPRFIFHGTSCFYLMCNLVIDKNKVELEAAAAEAAGRIVLPGLPHHIQVIKDQVIINWSAYQEWLEFHESTKEAEESADGVVVNSFVELEPWYFESYRKAIGKHVWSIGPLSQFNEEPDTKVARGRASSVDKETLLLWLDRKEAGSVVFVSFGSLARNSLPQIVELGCGLEASGRPFVWALKEAEEGGTGGGEVGEWAAEFDKRVGERGLVVKGWAPQTVILGHAAVGGFVTHCGWNSTLEAVAAGVPMVTWPHFADQFLNERMVVEVLRIGVALGVEKQTILPADEEHQEVKVWRGDVERAVVALMDGGEEGKERRKRARELGEKARRAMEEGGSSWEGLEGIIRHASGSEEKKDLKIMRGGQKF